MNTDAETQKSIINALVTKVAQKAGVTENAVRTQLNSVVKRVRNSGAQTS